MNTYSLGIDIGYSAVKMILIDNDNSIVYNKYQLHKGKINKTTEQLFNEIRNKFAISKIAYGAVTGSIGKALSENIFIKRVNEIAATIEGSIHINTDTKSIIELGGQSAKYIAGFNPNSNDRLRVNQTKQLRIETNTDCAAGTGSFLEEQASRLNISIEDYASIAEKATGIPRIAGRCSVFAKTDIIHNQQEGVSPENILKGLAYAIVRNYKGSIIKRSPVVTPVLFIGGVAHNSSITNAFCDILNIDSKNLIVPEYFDCITALGAALIAKEKKNKLDFSNIYSEFLLLNEISKENNSNQSLKSLSILPAVNISSKHDINTSIENKSCIDCYLGVDIGSTSTNLVVTNKTNDIIAYKYIRTAGKPLRAVYNSLNEIRAEFQDRINICGVGVTGSGRNMIGDAIGADVIRDEITAQAKAAVTIDPEVDTIFEIGGQDSKYISIKNGSVVDFQMNKICAAGTGSFLEEQSLKFDIPLEQFSDIALKGNNPVYLGERCTVFIESSIRSNLTNGKKTEDIISGLCYSIAKNYLHRVVGQKAIGNKIFLQGGIAYNQGVLNAMKIITKKEIVVPPFFSVTGAFGVAILAKEEMCNLDKSNFIGFDLISGFPKLPAKPVAKTKSENADKYNSIIKKLIFEDHISKIDPAKKTVGIPRALFTYGMFPMFNGIFKSLGFNVILSDWSDDDTIKLGQEYALAETCFPVKLITGHVVELVQKCVDYIFFPDLHTVKHEDSKARKNYGCAYMQLAFKIVSQTMELDKKGIQLLAPTIAFNLGEEFMRNSFANLGDKLGKTPEETKIALQEGMKAYHRFEERIESNRKEILKSLDPNKITFVLISKTYGVSDPVLNLGIPAKLMDMGYQVLPFFNIPGENVGQEHPNMFWPFGEHILEPTYLIREHPNLYPILLTHHGCGPDSVLVHYFKELIGDKAFLNIEIDEHASKIGVETRLEAFVNSLSQRTEKSAQSIEHYQSKIKHVNLDIKTKLNQVSESSQVYIPNLFPFAELICEYLNQNGHNIKVLPATNNESVSLGRKFTRTNEYFSMTSLLGDCFKQVNGNGTCSNFLIPQTEGAELDGQYNRMLRTKLDECNLEHVNIISPFIEDIVEKDLTDLRSIFRILIVGDLINTAPRTSRSDLLLKVKKLIQCGELNLKNLKSLTSEIHESINTTKLKRILTIGEPMVVLNDYLNDNSFNRIEDNNCQIIYFSLSEAMWMFWYDYINQNKKCDTKVNQSKLAILRNELEVLSKLLKNDTPFSSQITDLVLKADQTIGYYAGAFARYRFAKMLLPPPNIDGIITANSTYENTGVSLNILQKQHENEIKVPILNLNFDGDKTDYSKIETFIYYL